MDKRKTIVFSKHARERARETGKTTRELVDDIHSGFITDPPSKEYKYGKYNDQKDVFYVKNGPLVFVLVETKHLVTGENIYLVVTVTNQLATMRGIVPECFDN